MLTEMRDKPRPLRVRKDSADAEGVLCQNPYLPKGLRQDMPDVKPVERT
jgi:hypothetical protein